MARSVRRPVATAAVKKESANAQEAVKPAQKPKAPARIAQVPGKEYADTYVHRYIDGVKDFDLLDIALASNENVRIEGPTGSGKTSLVYAWAHARNLPLYSISSSAASDKAQMFGKLLPNKEGAGFHWSDGPVTDIFRHGGVLLINEGNFMPDRIASILFGATDKRRKIELDDHDGEVIYAEPGKVLIVLDMNPGYEGTRPLNKAFNNRFSIQLEFDYDPKIESKLVASKSLLVLASQVRDQIARGLYDTPVSTNMLVEFERIALATNLQFAIRNFAIHFPVDDRASIREVFAAHLSGIEADLKKSKGGAKAKKDDSWGEESFEESDLPSSDEFLAYELVELQSKTRDELIALAVNEAGISKKAVSSWSDDDIKSLLTGDHPWWNE